MRNLILRQVTFRNFMSWGQIPTTLRLDEPGATLIVGENLDDTTNGKTSNGVGKSSLVSTICYAMYGKTRPPISRDKLINNVNKSNMEVVLEMSIDTDDYVITRARKTKEGTFVKLEKNGVDMTLDSVDRTDLLIEQVIGIPFEIFVQMIFITANASSNSYFKLPLRSSVGPSQIGIIEDLFNYTHLTEKAEKLKYQIKQSKIKLDMVEQKFDLMSKEMDRKNNLIEQIKNRITTWDNERARKISEISKKLDKLKDIDVDEQLSIFTELTSAEKNFEKISKESRIITRSIQDITGKLSSWRRELDHLEHDRCPYCEQSLPDSVSKITSTKSNIDTREEELTHLKELLEENDKTKNEIATRIDDLSKHLKVADIVEISSLKSTVDTLASSLDVIKNEVNPHYSSLHDVENTPVEIPSESELSNIRNEHEHEKFLLKLLTKKDSFVRKKLLDTKIPYLNERIAHYLKMFGLKHKVEFTRDLTSKITQFGNELDYGNLSHGQQVKVDFALNFAFRDVLTKTRGYINFLMLDEATDIGLDDLGITNLVKIINEKTTKEKLSTIVISHKSEIDNMFENKIIIQMRDSFSYML